MAARGKKKQESASTTLDELETLGDRLSDWLDTNFQLVLICTGAILLVAAGVGAASWYTEKTAEEAAGALADLEASYRDAMGADPASLSIPEPANPETARAVRTEYVEKFRELAESHPGSAVGAVAAVTAGELQSELGNPDEALAIWQGALDGFGRTDPLRGVLGVRVAAAHEAAGEWADAANAYQSAASVVGFPLRHNALAEAARCFAMAGDRDAAIAAFDRLESDAPEFDLPPHVRSAILELKARS